MYKKAILTVAGIAGLVLMGAQGYLEDIWHGDITHIVSIIGILLVIGMIAVWRSAWRTVSWCSDAAVTVGLLGTVLGLIMSFHGFDPSNANSPFEAIGRFTSVAFFTTLSGGVVGLWLSLVHHICKGDQ